MKRSWFGLVLLAVLLVSALTVTWVMKKLHQPVTQDLEQAAAEALDGGWEHALVLADRAQTQWRRWEQLRGCFADHGPMEDIDAAFAELTVYGAAGEREDFAAACAALARRVEDMQQAHSLSFSNMF